MKSMGQHDAQRLKNDMKEVNKVLDALERDRILWARGCEEKDVSDLINCINQIEVDLSISMNKLISNNKMKNRGYVFEKMQHGFSYLNNLFQDIKHIKNNLDRFYIKPDELEILEIDWARFMKNMLQIIDYPQDKKPEGSPESIH